MSDPLSDDDRSLDERIEQFYEHQALPFDVLGNLREMVEAGNVRPNPHSARRPFLRHMASPTWSYAVGILLVIFAGASLFFWQSSASQQRHLESVAAEIALNHAKQFDTEFEVPSLAALSAEMTLLDFAPVHPKKLQYETYELDGARYCTIDSAIAIQVRMRDAAQQDYTLYQFRDSPLLPLDGEETIIVEGIGVTLWREGEIVMGLAERIEEQNR